MGKITPRFGIRGEPGRGEGGAVLTEVIDEMTAELASAKSEIAESRKEERRLAKQAVIAARATSDWEQRAMAAVRAGDDVVARDSLLRKSQHASEYERFREAERERHQETAKMTRAVVTLNFRIEDAKQKQYAVAAEAVRASSLPALARDVAEAMAVREADDVLKRLEAKMTDIETELELSDEAMANLTREASDALRSQDELALQKREAERTDLRNKPTSKPLAKTLPNDDTAPGIPQVAGIAAPERTKR